MQPTIEVIQPLLDEGKTPTEVAAILNAETVEFRDSTGWKLKSIIARWSDEFGAANGQAMAGKLSSSLSAMADANVPFVNESVIALSQPTGLGLDADSDQDMVDFLAAQSQALENADLRWGDSFVDAIKSLGLRTVKKYETSSEDVQAVILEDFAERLIQRVSAAIRLAATQDDATEDSVLAAASGELN